MRSVGIDLGTKAIYVVRTDTDGTGRPAVTGGRAFLSEDLSGVVDCADAIHVAIDAPDEPTTAPIKATRPYRRSSGRLDAVRRLPLDRPSHG